MAFFPAMAGSSACQRDAGPNDSPLSLVAGLPGFSILHAGTRAAPEIFRACAILIGEGDIGLVKG